MKRVGCFATVVFALTCFLASSAEASFVDSGVSDAVGNSGFTAGFGVAGWVNFAVYDNQDHGNWLTELGLTSGDLVGGFGSTTETERNVFFFQVTRADPGGFPGPVALENITIPAGENPWIGGGALDDFVFDEAGVGAVVGETGGANNTLGTDAAAGGTNLDGSLDATPFVANAAAVAPTVLSSVGGGAIRFSFTGESFDADEHSTVFFLTSHSRPLVTVPFETATTVQLGGGGPSASVPVSNPEPGSLILLSFAGIGAAGVAWRRRRKQKQDVATSTA